MGRVVHFEITADDVARARQFYAIFDWKITGSGMPDVEYWLVDTGEGEIGINGAIMPRAYNAQPVIHWVGVDDLDAMVEKVKAAGGQVQDEKQTVPGVGDTIYATDTEGNTFGMIQPLPRTTPSP
jgi:predicted enzyme related to lactoylglutathione lyase